jgi:hypothetical protein
MTDTKLVKAAGEHWGCSVLSRLGWPVALTRDGVARTDILATDPGSGWLIEVQVKTASFSTRPSWLLGTKAQEPARTDHEWFVFVVLGSEPWEAPRSFVVPRDHVSAAAWISHTNWLTEPGIPPGRRNAPLSKHG